MDSLSDILGQKDFDEPSEMAAIKKYVKDEFKAEVSVLIREKDIVISVPNAAFANTLRLRTPEIKRRCQTDKRLTFRIGR
ncbi:MAG TPA: hypothetical protein VFX84_01290 [Candidatus Saccharimonadales bacterium]|nr:hypothetical protein [Candidatus Saccharimonadales bacterium]